MPSGTLRSFWKKNKKVGAAVKAPMNAKSLLKKLDGVSGQAELTQLVNTYESIDPANDPDCSLRMTALRDIDLAIYKWFNHTSSDSLSNVKGAKAMVSLLKKAEQAHEQLVEATRNDPNVVPFDTTNLSQQEILDRKAVCAPSSMEQAKCNSEAARSSRRRPEPRWPRCCRLRRVTTS